MVRLQYLTAIPGSGWGCVVCDLPLNGAMAMLCDHCLHLKKIKHVCHGQVFEDGREPFQTAQARGPFSHDQKRHDKVGETREGKKK